jgi:hypothetical protein
MHELLLHAVRLVLLALMLVYLPLLQLVNWFASWQGAGMDALEIELLLARARRKVKHAGARR